MTVAVSSQSPITAQGAPLLSARKKLDIVIAYRQVGTYRGATEMCGVTHKTVKRAVERAEAGSAAAERLARRRNYESVRALVAKEIDDTNGKVSAKRLLPTAIAAGYARSARNFRRLVAQGRSKFRQGKAVARARRPAVWAPGEHLVIDWGVLGGLHVFCAVLAWSRVRFVRFADNERADTTLALLAECFETLGGVPKVVLADRMGCLKGGVVADVVIPTADYVRFATHYRFRPDFCHARDPESKGIVENLVGYSKSDLMIGLGLAGRSDGPVGLTQANAAALAWCQQVNSVRHSEIAAVPAQRLVGVERELLAVLPSLRPSIGRRELRKVDKLSCIRFGSARYSVPTRMLTQHVEVFIDAASTTLTVLMPGTGEVLAEHPVIAPGEVSVIDAHYGSTGGSRDQAPGAARCRPRDRRRPGQSRPADHRGVRTGRDRSGHRLGRSWAAVSDRDEGDVTAGDLPGDARASGQGGSRSGTAGTARVGCGAGGPGALPGVVTRPSWKVSTRRGHRLMVCTSRHTQVCTCSH